MGGDNICDTEKYETAGIPFSCKVTCSNLIAGGDKDSLYNKNCKDLCPSCYKFQVDRASASIVTLSPYRIKPSLTTPGTTTYVSPTPTSTLTPGGIVGICFAVFLIYIILEKVLIILLYRRTKCFKRLADKLLGNRDSKSSQVPTPSLPEPSAQLHTPQEPAQGARETTALIHPTPAPATSNGSQISIPSAPAPSTSRIQPPNDQTQIKRRWSDGVHPVSEDWSLRGQPDEVRDNDSFGPYRKTCTDSFLADIHVARRNRPRGNSGPTSFHSGQNYLYQSKEEGYQEPKSCGRDSIVYSDSLLESQLQSGDEQTIPKRPAQNARRNRYDRSPDDKYWGEASDEMSQTAKLPEQCTEDHAARKGCSDSFLAERLGGEGSSQTNIKELYDSMDRDSSIHSDRLPKNQLQNGLHSLP